MLSPKKGLGRAKARLKRALSRSRKANAGIARVQAGPERAQARLEKACSVAKGPTSHFLGCFSDLCVLLHASIGWPRQRFLLVAGVH